MTREYFYILLTVHLDVIPDGVLIQVGPTDDEHLLLETCRGIEINTLKKSVSSWSLTRITILNVLYRCETSSLISKRRTHMLCSLYSQNITRLRS